MVKIGKLLIARLAAASTRRGIAPGCIAAWTRRLNTPDAATTVCCRVLAALVFSRAGR